MRVKKTDSEGIEHRFRNDLGRDWRRWLRFNLNEIEVSRTREEQIFENDKSRTNRMNVKFCQFVITKCN